MKSLVESRGRFVDSIVSYNKKYSFVIDSSGDWLDFGHLNSFYHARTRMTTQRSFNELSINSRFVHKASVDKSKKIYAEARWFLDLPSILRLHTPILLDHNEGGIDNRGASYKLEYLYLLPLSDLFVFGRLKKSSWNNIFDGISQVLNDFSSFDLSNLSICFGEFDDFYLPKTVGRLIEFQQQRQFSVLNEKFAFDKDGLGLTLVDIARDVAQYIRPVSTDNISIVHGDMCFSNLLFDSRVDAIKCIDPRGLTPRGDISIYGDVRYDYAKLYHSVVGFYDFIIAGKYNLEKNKILGVNVVKINFSESQEYYNPVVESFKSLILSRSKYEESEILAITIHLFLSMLPLHSDRPDRQDAFVANALRLYKMLKEIKS